MSLTVKNIKMKQEQNYTNYSIYCLCCPKDNTIRYIGITKRILDLRLKCHIAEASRCKKKNLTRSYKINWILSLIDQNLYPTIHLIEEVKTNSSVKAYLREEELIKEYKSLHPLINSTHYKGIAHYKDKVYLSDEANTKKKGVVVLNKQGQKINSFRSEKECVEFYNGTSGMVSSVLTKRKKSYKNMIFIFEKEYDESIDYSFKPYSFDKSPMKTKKPEYLQKHKESLRKSMGVKVVAIKDSIEKVFNSLSEAIEQLNLSKSLQPNISACLKGKRNKAGGYKWKYYF